MFKLNIFDVLEIGFLAMFKSLFSIKIDTAYLPFSIHANFLPFYKLDEIYFHSEKEYDDESGRLYNHIFIIIPYLLDISIYIDYASIYGI